MYYINDFLTQFPDLQFPIDLSNVAKDHPFLENDPMQSLYRRLVALNKCATMRIDNNRKHPDNVSIISLFIVYVIDRRITINVKFD